jgi:predicted RNA-binding protein with TRAM domain
MAIGKVGAFATVQAPNVDFGEIALNAQKFQAADLERQKELKIAQLKAEKEKPFVFTPQTFKNDSGLDFYNISQIDDANKVVGEYYNLSKLNEAGQLDSTGAAKLQALKQNFENADNALKTVGVKYSEYVKGIKDHSGAYKGTEDYLQGFTADNGKNVIRSTDSNGNPYFQQAEMDPQTKRPLMGGDGKPVIRKFIDKDGIERDGWGHADILSGRAFEPLNSFDDKGFATDVAKLVGPDKIGTDNGVTKIVRERLNDANISTINTLITTQVLNNPDHLKDVLYKLDPVKYKNPKSEYTDEDKAFAKKGMENSIYGGIGLSSVTDVDSAEIARRAKEKQEQEKYSYTIGRSSWAQNKLGASISNDVDKTAFGFPLVKVPMYSVKAGHYFNEQGVAATNPLPAGSYISNMTLIRKGDKEIPGFVVQQLDAKSSREVQDKIKELRFNTNISEEDQQSKENEILSSYGNKYTQHIYTFSKEDADNILRQQTIGANKGKGYNVDFAKTTLRNAQGKVQKNKVGVLD